MDFQSLSRRELQSLCKKNKIPANITNVAMANALKELEIVEGIEEFLEPSQSETAHSSMDSPARSEVTSPYVPPSGVRSTRRRQFRKEEPEKGKSMSRSRHVLKTPAVEALQSGEEDLLKECVEDEKKGDLMTPAPLRVPSRRRRAKEDSTVKRVNSTRRSVRLAEKSMKKMLNEDLGDSDEVSEITGVDTNTNSLESPDKYSLEVVSAENQSVPIVEEIKLASSAEEGKGSHFEVISPQQNLGGSDAPNEVSNEPDEEEEEKTEDPYCQIMSGKGETEEREHRFEADDPEWDMKKCSDDKERELEETKIDETEDMLLNLNDEAETDEERGDKMVDASDESTVMLLNKDEARIGIDPESAPGEETSDKTENLIGESTVMALNLKQNVEDMDGLKNACNKDSEDNASDYITDNVLENEDSFPAVEFSSNTETNDEIETEMHNDTDVDSRSVPHLDMAIVKLTGLTLQQDDSEESTKTATAANLVEDDVATSVKSSGTKVVSKQDDEPLMSFQIPPDLPSSKVSSTTAVNDRMPIFSDNKENIGSGGKLVPSMKGRAKDVTAAKKKKNVNLDTLSVGELKKMLKERLKNRDDDGQGCHHHGIGR